MTKTIPMTDSTKTSIVGWDNASQGVLTAWPVWRPGSRSCGCPGSRQSGWTGRALGCWPGTAPPPCRRWLGSTGYGTGRWTWTGTPEPGSVCVCGGGGQLTGQTQGWITCSAHAPRGPEAPGALKDWWYCVCVRIHLRNLTNINWNMWSCRYNLNWKGLVVMLALGPLGGRILPWTHEESNSELKYMSFHIILQFPNEVQTKHQMGPSWCNQCECF